MIPVIIGATGTILESLRQYLSNIPGMHEFNKNGHIGHGTHTTPPQPNHNEHQHVSNQSNTTHEITQQINHKLLRMDVLTSETC